MACWRPRRSKSRGNSLKENTKVNEEFTISLRVRDVRYQPKKRCKSDRRDRFAKCLERSSPVEQGTYYVHADAVEKQKACLRLQLLRTFYEHETGELGVYDMPFVPVEQPSLQYTSTGHLLCASDITSAAKIDDVEIPQLVHVRTLEKSQKKCDDFKRLCTFPICEFSKYQGEIDTDRFRVVHDRIFHLMNQYLPLKTIFDFIKVPNAKKVHLLVSMTYSSNIYVISKERSHIHMLLL